MPEQRGQVMMHCTKGKHGRDLEWIERTDASEKG